MNFQKLIPGAGSAFRPRFKSTTQQNVLDRVSSDRLDAELSQFSENPRVAPAVVFRQLEHQLFDVGPRSWSPNFPAFLCALCCLAHPPPDGVRMHDGRQFVQSLAEILGEPAQPSFLSFGETQPGRQLAAQNLVLYLEVADLPGQFLLHGARDQQNQRVVSVPKACHRRFALTQVFTSRWRQFCTPGQGLRE